MCKNTYSLLKKFLKLTFSAGLKLVTCDPFLEAIHESSR